MLCNPLCNSSHNNAFLDELRKLGWVEGTTIDIERKDPDYRPDQLPVLAADLVRSKPDLIVAFTPQAARAAKDATSDIPIVILFVADPVAMGLASSLAHPGGNLTDVATLAPDPSDLGGKSLEILRELLPQAKRVVPSISLPRSFAQGGGLISYGPDFPAMAQRGAHYVDRILKGAKPAELPIEQPTKFLLVINLKTAKSLGLEIPASLLARADEVIE
jgi:ABC-type uncharacterized transport system substrate-binding protein